MFLYSMFNKLFEMFGAVFPAFEGYLAGRIAGAFPYLEDGKVRARNLVNKVGTLQYSIGSVQTIRREWVEEPVDMYRYEIMRSHPFFASASTCFVYQ